MVEEGYRRKLTTILSADVAGYSRLMRDDEAATVKTLEQYKQVMSELIHQHRGRVIDSPGDNLLAEFISVVDAVQCAVATQKELQARNTELPETRRMQFRIGVNLGDVIEEESRIYGDGVNIAARLEAIADPGGICVSKTAFDQIETKLPFGYTYLGEQTVKNIAKPVEAYKVLMEPRVMVAGPQETPRVTLWGKKGLLAGAFAMVICIIGIAVWNVYFRPPANEPISEKKTAFPPMDKASVAVLPFVNISDDPKQEYFCDGVSEQIITGLSQGPYIYVTSRTSSFAYRDKSMTAKQIAEELGVRYLLEGSAQREGDRVRINAQLIDGNNGNHIWAKRYDREYKELFALQDEITMDVMSNLNLKMTGFQVGTLSYSRPKNLEAYEHYLRGMYYHLGRKKEDIPLAREAMTEALNPDNS